jgi:DNA invertase Pin-like site-specific DNA recombinase
LSDWVWKQKKPKFDGGDEEEFLELSERIPAKIREGLIEIAKSLPGRRGGKDRAFNMREAWHVRSRVSKVREEGLSKKYAYRKIALELKCSEHTIRRTCEPKERKRSRQMSRSYALLAT